MAKRRCFCNACGRETDHDVVWRNIESAESPSEELFEIELLILRCRGCKECTILQREREVTAAFAPPDVTETYEPPRLWRRAPDWLPSLQELDPDLKALLDEIYSATNAKQLRLLSMGVRSALDYVMTKILAADLGSFSAKLDEMVKRGHIASKQRDHLAIVIDAGSAATHRGFKPPQDLLDQMLAVMESVIRDHYITGPMLSTAKTQIPPRP
jgi:Domain of unknown function (DUF4145)